MILPVPNIWTFGFAHCSARLLRECKFMVDFLQYARLSYSECLAAPFLGRTSKDPALPLFPFVYLFFKEKNWHLPLALSETSGECGIYITFFFSSTLLQSDHSDHKTGLSSSGLHLSFCGKASIGLFPFMVRNKDTEPVSCDLTAIFSSLNWYFLLITNLICYVVIIS